MPSTSEQLRTKTLFDRWSNAIREVSSPADPAMIDDTFRTICNHYGEKARKYHTLTHIEEMFELLDQCPISQRGIVTLAIFLHDAIYDPKDLTGNEDNSAWLAEEVLQKLGVSEDVRTVIKEYIRATRDHRLPPGYSAEGDLAYFLDADMAILGSSHYNNYANKIAGEFSWAPSTVYKRGRKMVLKSMLRSQIYVTKQFIQKFDYAARWNILSEIIALDHGFLPPFPEADN